MKYVKSTVGQGHTNHLVVRLDEGDSIMHSIKKIAVKEKITGAFLTGIGAARKAEIAHYNTVAKKYETRIIGGNEAGKVLEVVAMNGNITLDEHGKESIVHIHIALGLEDYTTASGHLIDAEVSPTLEVLITIIDGDIKRKLDEKSGLRLQEF